jgi:hypothetical protein
MYLAILWPYSEKKTLRRKSCRGHQAKRRKNMGPKNRKTCQIIISALLESIAVRAQSTMKRSKQTLHELSPHIPQKTPKRNKSS